MRFWVIPKITPANLCKPIHDNLFPICPSESGKCGMEGEKLQKMEYLKNKKNFLNEIKYIFHSFWRAIIWWKKKKKKDKRKKKQPQALSIWWRPNIWRSEKLKSDYIKNEKSFQSEIKNIFSCFKSGLF